MAEWPPVAERIRAAREAAGLSEEAVADRVGLGVAWYRDLEAYDDEAFTNVSLAHLRVLASVLGVSPRALLLGPGAPAPAAGVSFSDLSAALEAHRLAAGLSLAELSARVGWELGVALVDPSEFWNFTADGLREACLAVGFDWVAALPD